MGYYIMATKLNVKSPRLVVEIPRTLKRKVAAKCKAKNTSATQAVRELLTKWVENG